MTSTEFNRPTTLYQVLLADGDDANGLARILAVLIRQNLRRHPPRVATARRIRQPVVVHNLDERVTATVVFGDGAVTIQNGVAGNPVITVHTAMPQLIDFIKLRMECGGLVPVGFLSRGGLRVLRAVFRRNLTFVGFLRHPLSTLRFLALVSVF